MNELIQFVKLIKLPTLVFINIDNFENELTSSTSLLSTHTLQKDASSTQL